MQHGGVAARVMYQATTRGIQVSVTPAYLEQQSEPGEGRWVWAYTIEIENMGESTVQLIDRYWHITDAKGRVQEVSGPGVVGEQPVLAPGDGFTYTSGCPLQTSSGIMRGHFGMEERGSGMRFMVEVPPFSLDSPNERRTVN